jgi:hypothetical protein
MHADAIRVWNDRTSVQSRLTISRFRRLCESSLTTPAMGSAASTRRLQLNRHARLIVCLAATSPAISRPIWARLTRSRRTEAATSAARVADWVGGRFEVTPRTHARIDWADTVAPSTVRGSEYVNNTTCPAHKVGSHRVFLSEAEVGMSQGPRSIDRHTVQGTMGGVSRVPCTAAIGGSSVERPRASAVSGGDGGLSLPPRAGAVPVAARPSSIRARGQHGGRGLGVAVQVSQTDDPAPGRRRSPGAGLGCRSPRPRS